jgi:hypothetical protein
MAAEQNHSERKMNECGVTLNAAIPPCNHAFELVELLSQANVRSIFHRRLYRRRGRPS